MDRRRRRITGDVKYISLKKAFLNPSMLGMVIALPLFLLRISLPDAVMGPVSLLAKMTTPVCMLILGMRFGTVKLREIFSERSIYPSALVKLIIVPLLAFAATYFMPVPSGLKAALIIMSACPTANVVLSLSELYGVGQKTAALAVLSSTLFSVVTIPVVCLCSIVNKTGLFCPVFCFSGIQCMTKKRFYFILTL